MRGICLSVAAVLLLVPAPAARGQSWSDAIIPEKTYDFGTVARGSRLRHAFRIVNATEHDVHIAGWRTKCGCTDVKVGSKAIPPGTQTTIEVTLDTTKFQDHKASGITLIFDRPQFAEVDLTVNAFIRSEVLLSPGSVDLGVVPRGTARTQRSTLTYHGSVPDWSITKLNTISEHVTAELREVSRSPGGAVQYALTATLNPTAPAGYFRDEITLSTSDPSSPTIPVSVTATVQPAVSVAPAVLNLGRLKPGQTVEKVVVVRAGRPFRVVEATASASGLSAAVPAADSARPLHTLKVRLTAPEQPGPFHSTLEVLTDLDGEPPARLQAFATIVP